jgi:nucleotide-binding universal stress UspA family protein
MVGFQNILVPTDFGPGSQAALTRALDSLGPEGGRVMVLHVIDERLLEPTLALFPEARIETLLARLREQAHARYAQLIASIAQEQVELEPLIVEGVPFVKIVQFARDLDVDLIVMAVHRGPAHFEQFLFGSTAERVRCVAPCPVLICPRDHPLA